MDARASGADSVQKVCGAGEGAVLVGASVLRVETDQRYGPKKAIGAAPRRRG